MKVLALTAFALSSTAMLCATQYYQGQNPTQGYTQGQATYQGQAQNQQYYNPGQNQQYYNQGQTQPNYNQGQPQVNYNTQGQPQSNYNTQGQTNYQGQTPSNFQNNQYSNNQNPNNNRNQPQQNQGPATDEEIAKQVHDIISTGWFSSGYPSVTFVVNDGSVTLQGYVEKEEDRTKIEQAVKNVRGVRQVTNEVTVGTSKTAYTSYNNKAKRGNTDAATTTGSTATATKAQKDFPQDRATTDSDRALNAKIRDKLSGWFTKGYETVVFTTSNGVVTITGFVEKFDDIQKINKEVKNVDGVKTINNQLSVKK